MEYLFLSLLIIPFVWIFFLGLSFFARLNLSERFLSESSKWLSIIMSLLSLLLSIMVLLNRSAPVSYDAFTWLSVGDYEFKIRFLVDLLGSTYALLTSLLIGIIFRFSRNYLHKEEGYFRFIFLLSTLLLGLMIVSFARSLDLIFAGWELVGTTSVLLIGYFYVQSQPVRHSLKAIVSYRFCDMGILAAAAWAHHYMHTTDFTTIPSLLHGSHLHEAGHGGPVALTFIGLFIIWAALAKSGQLPFSSWLPAAMEGPTPSSAIFYGALSVHLGPFLLLRFYDFFEHFPLLLWVIGSVGALSSLYASGVGRTRSDAKTMLAYATISQVGIIWVEIALGFKQFALFHIVAHASLRTWQYLRSASLIQDFFENPVVQQNQKIQRSLSFEKLVSHSFRKRFYIHALHGFHLDYFTSNILVVLSMPFRWFMDFERKWMTLNNSIVKFIFQKR
jgi:NADH:ubiquinone oxidoreductase subunit 5 (subunit L)/multisubunit Na+/H+ antiporter MnhA subunit